MKKDDLLIGRYRIIEQIGVGGMSYVYKAEDTVLKRIIAIKILKEENACDAEFVAKFKREAESSARLSHPNIIQAYDVIEDNDLHCIVLEYVEGKTLKNYIQEKGHLTNEETINFAIQIAKGLEHAHQKGIIHRDIKPQNVIINKKHIALISDFGIARAVGQATTTTTAVGSIHYMSPEQSQNAEVDKRSDIYSLGCTMYEMITGKVPFEGDSVAAVVMAHIKGTLKKPSEENPEIYKSLEKIILKATQKDPEDRYQEAKELISDLKKAAKKKDGSYVDFPEDDELDEEGTIRISDTDMQTIKNWSEGSKTKNNSGTLTNKLKAKKLLKKYTKSAIKEHQRRTIIAIIGFFVLCIVIAILGYNLYKYSKRNKEIEKSLETTNDRKIEIINKNEDTTNDASKLVVDLLGANINSAKEIAKPYNITFNITKEIFDNDSVDGTILEINGKEFDKNSTIDVVISKGPEVLNFSDTKWLNSLRVEELIKQLEDRKLKYTIDTDKNNTIPVGYVISTNKKLSTDAGDLIINVSLGDNDTIEEVQQNTNTIDDPSHWYSKINTTCIVGAGEGPNGIVSDTVTIGIRLKQAVGNEAHYTELIEPKTYKSGTKIPIVFPNLQGEIGLINGTVEVVDVINEKVLNSFDIVFLPKYVSPTTTNIILPNEGKGPLS